MNAINAAASGRACETGTGRKVLEDLRAEGEKWVGVNGRCGAR